MKQYFIVCLAIMGASVPTVSAQMDSMVLDSTHVSVRGNIEHRAIDTFHVSSSDFIAEVLSQQALVFVKPASGTGLSTISIRGGTPEQSAIFWNGLSLQNTLNGNVDLNLLPAVVFDNISLNNTNSVRTGSGGTAGSMELQNQKIDTNNTTQLNIGAGSFGLFNASTKSVVNLKRSRISLAAYVQESKNNYPYSTAFQANKSRLAHAEYQLAGILYQQTFDTKSANPLNIRLWAQSATRNIPATTLEAESKKNQVDNSIRFQSDWSKVFKKNEVKLVFGSFVESLRYSDSIAQIFTDYGFMNNSLLVHVKRRLVKNLTVGADIEARHFGADADTFYNQSRLEFSEGGHVKLKAKKWVGHLGFRFVQFSTTSDAPVLFSSHVSREIKNKWNVTASFNTNYRLPTFNSLFWNPGGNPNLTAERSRNADVMVKYVTKSSKVQVSVFNNYIHDQIRWLPGANGIFEAQQVLDQIQWNRGLEISGEIYFKRFMLDAGGSRLISTVVGDDNQYQQSYVPLYQGYTNLNYTIGEFSFRLGYQLVSKRFIDTENTSYLEGYYLHRGQVTWKHKHLLVSFIARNIGDLSYTVLPFRPNPPRNFQLDITYTIHKNKTK